ncbi:hypothetical protein [Asticcacaulis sp. EMRT-3]|uniref:hypothetical protein n=1 Tax=Asticcacaulis sp. EMRT-3 TaxID=3040349 RepID=UPI0024AFC6B0|nr:hypothetical protein [Asticcacaulis sp. EMRT-3]MDI7774421.1 hypothetical protein [Asticcacaulis sp. EMRT-3]
MDALSVLRALTRNRLLLALFALFCAWPVGYGVWHMITHHAWMLMDIDAVLCGAKTLAAHRSPYAIHPPVCDAIRPAAYVYAPQVAYLFFPLLHTFGVAGTRTLFIWLLLAPATLFLLWFALIRPFPGIDIRYRLLAFAALTPMTFVCANIGLVMHALVLASLLLFRKTRWPFTLVVFLCACVKPTFLAYFILFLLADEALWRRVFAFSWRAVAGVGIFYLMIITDGHYGHAWQKTLHSVAMARQVGMGWFELTNFVFHVRGSSHLNVELALGFMVVMLLAGMAMARWGKLTSDERLVLVMGLVPLMTPRLLDYDMVLIVPYAALLISLIHRIGGKVLAFVLSWIFTIWLIYGIITTITGDSSWHRTPMDMLLFGLLTGITGLTAAFQPLLQGRKDDDETGRGASVPTRAVGEA